MDAAQPSRARPELVWPGGFDDLLPPRPADFVTIERISLEAPSTAGAAAVLAARRAHLASGRGPIIIDLPAGIGPAPAITATTVLAAIDDEPTAQISIAVGTAGAPTDGVADDGVDHWSVDLDADGLVHRATITGDGTPPSWIAGVAVPHDADRVVALRIVDRTGSAVTSETTIPARGW